MQKLFQGDCEINESFFFLPVAGTAPGKGGGGRGSGSTIEVVDVNMFAGGGGKDSMDGEPDEPIEDTEERDECDEILKLDVREGCLRGEPTDGTGALVLRFLALCLAEKE